MEAHNRDLYLYKRLNARVLGVSMDDPVTNRFFAKSLDLEFPIISNVLPWMAMQYGAYSPAPPFLPDGDKYEYLCSVCSYSLGTKMEYEERDIQILS